MKCTCAASLLVAIALVAFTAGDALSQPVEWTGDAGTTDWNTDGNWSAGITPTPSDDTYIASMGSAATVDLDGMGEAGDLYLAYDAAGTLNVSGNGYLSVDNLYLSPNGSPASLNLSDSADVYAETGLYIDGPSTIQMTGGLLHAALIPLYSDGAGDASGGSTASALGELVIGANSSGQFNLHGGTVVTGTMSMEGALTLDITHGSLSVVDGDRDTILGWIDAGKISSYGAFYDPSLFNIQGGSVTARVANPHPGDYNADGYLTDADFTVWADTYGSTTDLRADGNGDGVVSDADYTIWADSYGTVSESVPEPAAMLVLGLGSLGLLKRRR